jgi:hypothetical protein
MTAGEVEAALRRADVRSIHFHRRVPVTVRGDR